jgi:hypothetical protein
MPCPIRIAAEYAGKITAFPYYNIVKIKPNFEVQKARQFINSG